MSPLGTIKCGQLSFNTQNGGGSLWDGLYEDYVVRWEGGGGGGVRKLRYASGLGISLLKINIFCNCAGNSSFCEHSRQIYYS